MSVETIESPQTAQDVGGIAGMSAGAVGAVTTPQRGSGRARPKGLPEAKNPLADADVLVVERDDDYRDRVLVPSLASAGFRRVYAADSALGAERHLRRHPRPAVVVTGSVLRGGEDGLAVCRLARDVSIPTVLLTSFEVPEHEVDALVDCLIRKRDTSVRDTVEQVRSIVSSTGRAG